MAASFSAGVKAEICKTLPAKRCCALAQCFGILLFCNSFQAENIRIITESRDFAQLLPKLFKKAFQLEFDVIPNPEGKGKQIFQITEPDKIRARNLLSLMVSKDLIHWEVAWDLLDYRDHDANDVGFQYVDFMIEGNDILYLCRTAMNGAHNYHDANYQTFHRIKNFRDL